MAFIATLAVLGTTQEPVEEVSVITEETPAEVEETPQEEPNVETIIHKVVLVTKKEPEYISLGEFRVTAYCSCEKCCGRWAANRPTDENGNPIVIGASGTELVPNKSIAVDPSVIPYGSTVYINGQAYEAHDCGGAIKGNSIDIYMSSHEEAAEFGLQYLEVFIEKEGEQ